MEKHSKARQALVEAIGRGTTLIVPGAHDPISAKLIERHQFPAVYVGSYATSTGDLEEAIRRLNAYSDAGADLVMPTRISPKVLAECRSRIKAQVVVTDKAGFSVEDEMRSGASIVLYYGLSLYASYHGIKTALESFINLQDADKVPHLRTHIEEFEAFMDYESFARRATKFGVVS